MSLLHLLVPLMGLLQRGRLPHFSRLRVVDDERGPAGWRIKGAPHFYIYPDAHRSKNFHRNLFEHQRSH